jgi:hypothetical protein
MTATRNKTFIGRNGQILGFEAMRKYPDPVFFERGNPRMSHDEIRCLIRRNADEVNRVVDLIRITEGPMGGVRISKANLLYGANLLHDMRILVDIHGGEPGRPYLWEK